MKEGWEYKKLGEVCETSSGGTPSKNKKEFYEGGNIPWLRSGEVAQGLIYKSELFITEKGLNNSSAKLFPIDTIVLAMYGATVGQVGLLKKEMATNQAICGIFPNKSFIPMFLLYSLRAKKPFFMKDAVGGAQPNISQNLIKKTLIPIPPLSEQQRIVEELDLLSSIIDKKKEQLKELDNLAQSIFYDMFGDPVTNEKGWEVKKIGEIGSVERGAGISKKDFVENGKPCIHYGQLHTIFGAITHKHRTCIPHDLLPKYKIAHSGDVVMAITSEDVEGSCKSTAWLGNYDIVVGSDAAIFHHNINGVYISYYTQTKAFFNEKAKYANGFKVTHISTKEIEKIPIPLPPLSLQQQFASKIEAIEQQKELIKQSIKEVETLFNSRMDYYFN